MPAFRYVAILPTGELTRGVMDAADQASAIATIQRQGNIAMRADPADARGGFWRLFALEPGRGRSLRKQEVADFTRELSVMLSAGQDLDRALRFLAEAASKPRVRGVIAQLRDTVRDGGAFAAALARQPASFRRLYVGLVRAGEAGGQLGPTLDHLATLLERERTLSRTVTSALIYPAILSVVTVGAISLLLTQVLPEFVPLFQQNGLALPGPTQALIDLGAAVSAYGAYALAAVMLLVLLARATLRRPGPGLVFDRFVLGLPVIGRLAREVLAARFCRTLGTLVLNGVPLLGSLAIVGETLGNRAGVLAVQDAAVSAKAGAGLSGPLAASGVFPLRTVHLLRLGEETAQLGPMALRAAEIHEENARTGMQRVVSLLVPAITLLMGAAVAGIASSLVLAMLSLNDLAQ